MGPIDFIAVQLINLAVFAASSALTYVVGKIAYNKVVVPTLRFLGFVA